jgi:hypothetical protein
MILALVKQIVGNIRAVAANQEIPPLTSLVTIFTG